MKNKFVAIGDSFVHAHCTQSEHYDEDKHFWFANIKNKHPEFEYYNNGGSSRDIQTIIDIWIKLLPILTEQDYLVVSIPDFFPYFSTILYKPFRVI